MNPLIQALRELGGSGTADEIYEKVVEIPGALPIDKLRGRSLGAKTRLVELIEIDVE